MTEQPTRSEIEWALIAVRHACPPLIAQIIEFAARQYLASLDASAPKDVVQVSKGVFAQGYGLAGSPKDGTRELTPRFVTDWEAREYEREHPGRKAIGPSDASPPVPQEMATRELPDNLRIPLHSLKADARYLFGRVAQDKDVASIMADSVLERLSQIETACYQLANPPVPQEGVSEFMLEAAMDAYRYDEEAHGHRDKMRSAVKAVAAPLLEENARLRAALPSYGCWKQLSEAHARIKELEYSMHLTDGVRDEAEARVKELEAFIQHNTAPYPKDVAPLLEENARLRQIADGILTPCRLTRLEKLDAAEAENKLLWRAVRSADGYIDSDASIVEWQVDRRALALAEKEKK